MHENDDFLHRLNLIFALIKKLLKFQQDAFSRQEEMFALIQSISERLPVPEKVPVYKSSVVLNEWLDAYEAKELLKTGDLTLRRRRQDGTFIAKKIGKKWFYLRSSLQ